MISTIKVYIAGVGLSPLPNRGLSTKEIVTAEVSACVKALLDAGISYDDVTYGVHTSDSGRTEFKQDVFRAFDDDESITIDQVLAGTEMDSCFRLVRDKGAQCVLTIIVEEAAVIAIVAVSEDFLWRHPYLKDSAAQICESLQSSSQVQGGLANLCHNVWALRGWSETKGSSDKCYRWKSRQTYEVTRADTRGVPKWEDIQHKLDGRNRLGYNPAKETRPVFQEDLEAVRATSKARSSKAEKFCFKRRGGDRAALTLARL